MVRELEEKITAYDGVIGIHDLQVLYSDEQPVRMEKISDEQWRESGSLLGTMSYFPPIMGQMIASRVIRDLLGWA